MRDKALVDKIEEFKSEKGTMLPAKQIEALKEKLKTKNSTIYIKRSKASLNFSLKNTITVLLLYRVDKTFFAMPTILTGFDRSLS